RLALVNRLARLDVASLRKHLGEGDVEIRRAAVRACGEKKDADLAADLVPLLDGGDATTAGPARGAPAELTRRGPAPPPPPGAPPGPPGGAARRRGAPGARGGGPRLPPPPRRPRQHQPRMRSTAA